MILYIIGNGFDLKHNLPTSYSHFADYCNSQELYHDLYEQINEGFDEISTDSLWSNFEEGLGKPNQVLMNKFYLAYVKNEKNDLFLNFLSQLKFAFKDWICSVKRLITNKLPKRYYIDENSAFISFNYTNVLEALYLIPSSKIFHIHGYAKDKQEEESFHGYIFGHGFEELKIKDHIDSKDYLTKDFINELHKQYQIDELHNFLSKENLNVNSIMVLGHSLNKIDDRYFNYINNVSSTNFRIK